MENEEIDNLIKELKEIENKVINNIEVINIIIIKINNNNEIESIIQKKQSKKIKISKELIYKILNKIKDNYCSDEYGIKYLLNFEINKNINELDNIEIESQNINKSAYNLNVLNKLEDITYNNKYFNNINSLIFILNKLEKKYYIKRKRKKNNTTKKIK
tara:strand:- start:4 stop:480 length:477 start_codon:yes stop_codon:yes gene_type:complete